MAKQNRESNRRRFNPDRNESASKGPDPTINKELIHPELEVEVETTPEPQPEVKAVAPVPAPVPVTTTVGNKRTRARQAARSKSVDEARQQIFHRAGTGGLALGEPIKTSRDEDLDESE